MHFRTFVLGIVGLAAAVSAPAAAQSSEKAEIVVRNSSGRAVTVRYDFVFRTMSWNLIAFDVSPDGETTYRRPSNIVGCAQLNSWGIDQGRLTLSQGETALCTEPVSICDPTRVTVEVRTDGCRTRRDG